MPYPSNTTPPKHMRRNSITSADMGALPVDMYRTRPPSLSRSLLKTILSHNFDGGVPSSSDFFFDAYAIAKSFCFTNPPSLIPACTLSYIRFHSRGTEQNTVGLSSAMSSSNPRTSPRKKPALLPAKRHTKIVTRS
eukprot:30497-Pelagococcus_subviridis.AAC.3